MLSESVCNHQIRFNTNSLEYARNLFKNNKTLVMLNSILDLQKLVITKIPVLLDICVLLEIGHNVLAIDINSCICQFIVVFVKPMLHNSIIIFFVI